MEVYVKNINRSNNIKHWLKILFFGVAVIAWLSPLLILYISLRYIFLQIDKIDGINNINIESILGIVTIIMPSFVSIIIAFLKIPKIIAKYLFDKEEENKMFPVIENIQMHDKNRLELQMLKEKKAEEALREENANKIDINEKIQDSGERIVQSSMEESMKMR